MTYPPSPYGGYPGQGQPQQQYPQQSYGVPPQQQYDPEGQQQYYAPQPPAGPGRSKKNLPIIIILTVVLVVLIGGGVFAWLFWPQEKAPQQAAAGTSSALSTSVTTTQQPKSSLRGRSKEELLKTLPTLQDMPTGWREEPQGSSSSGEIAPEECSRVMPKGVLTSVINRYFDNPEDKSQSGIEAYLFEWNAEPQPEKARDFISRCATYTRTTQGSNGAPNTVITVNVKEVVPPKNSAESSLGYEESGTISPVPDGQDPTVTPERYYLGSLRGVNLVLFCRNSIVIQDKCNEVFTRTITQLANFD